MWWKASIAALLLAAPLQAAAKRGDDQSICDYYANELFGASNVTTQLNLMQGIVALAYAGGDGLHYKSKDSISGIFNKGKFKSEDVYLREWFNGSKQTTNINDQPAAVDWLDSGGTGPLMAYLNGSSKSIELKKTSNQYRLFTHWYLAFGRIYSCSKVEDFLPDSPKSAPLPPPYVHKYMDLDQTQIGYFIDQLIIASKHFGFSDEDAQTLSVAMNNRYNTRCAPATNGKLYSICLNKDCPLAAPESDCEAYKNVKADGGDPVTAAPSTAGTQAPPPQDTSSSSADSHGKKHSGSKLAGGAIAGIVIGCVAVVLIAVGLWLLFRRQRRKNESTATEQTTEVSAAYPSYAPYSPTNVSSPGPHESYMGSPSLAWPDEPKHHQSSGYAHELPSPDTTPANLHHSVVDMRQVAEIDSPEPPADWGRQSAQLHSTSQQQ